MSGMKSPLEIIFSMKQKNVIVHLKNGFNIRGLLEDVDYFLNLKLSNVIATDKNINIFKRANAVFLRGNLISSIVLEKGNLNTKLINNSKEQKNMFYFNMSLGIEDNDIIDFLQKNNENSILLYSYYYLNQY